MKQAQQWEVHTPDHLIRRTVDRQKIQKAVSKIKKKLYIFIYLYILSYSIQIISR